MKTFINTEHRRTRGGKLAAFAAVAAVAVWTPAFNCGRIFGEDMVDTFKNGEFDVNFPLSL